MAFLVWTELRESKVRWVTRVLQVLGVHLDPLVLWARLVPVVSEVGRVHQVLLA